MMFGFGSKKVKKDLSEVVNVLNRRHWNAEVADKESTVVVNQRYYSNKSRKSFNRLYLKFLGDGKVQFKDVRGEILSEVSEKELYPEMMDITNILPLSQSR